MISLTRAQVIMLHDALSEETGGAKGLRDAGALDAALSAPSQSFGGKDLFPTVDEKIVRLAYGLVRDHAFTDGNKRVGALALICLFELNDMRISFDRAEMERVILGVASGEVGYDELLAWCNMRIA